MPAGHPENVLLGGGFVCVHLALGVFAFVGHFVPGTLEMNSIPLTDCWESDVRAACFYLLAALLLMAINTPYALRFFFPSSVPCLKYGDM